MNAGVSLGVVVVVGEAIGEFSEGMKCDMQITIEGSARGYKDS